VTGTRNLTAGNVIVNIGVGLLAPLAPLINCSDVFTSGVPAEVSGLA
jgi:hypothetical protein